MFHYIYFGGLQDKVDDVKDMNLCQFVCDKLHEELSVGKLSAACLLHMIVRLAVFVVMNLFNLIFCRSFCF